MDQFQRTLANQLSALLASGMTDLPVAKTADLERFESWLDSIPNATTEVQTDQDPPTSGNLATQAMVQESILPETTSTFEYPPAVSAENRQTSLEVIRTEVEGCQECSELAAHRTQTVFGVGNPMARLCFLGEAPGADEDRQGEPFVGKAGQLLTRIIEACQLKRSDVYILNTLKCRPPGNRNPAEDEISNCWRYAHRQLELIQPEVIVCLGGIAAKTLLNTKQSVGRLRQQFHSYRGSQVVVTYHPAYILRNPSAKRSVWDDMKMVMSHLGVEL